MVVEEESTCERGRRGINLKELPDKTLAWLNDHLVGHKVAQLGWAVVKWGWQITPLKVPATTTTTSVQGKNKNRPKSALAPEFGWFNSGLYFNIIYMICKFCFVVRLLLRVCVRDVYNNPFINLPVPMWVTVYTRQPQPRCSWWCVFRGHFQPVVAMDWAEVEVVETPVGEDH